MSWRPRVTSSVRTFLKLRAPTTSVTLVEALESARKNRAPFIRGQLIEARRERFRSEGASDSGRRVGNDPGNGVLKVGKIPAGEVVKKQAREEHLVDLKKQTWADRTTLHESKATTRHAEAITGAIIEVIQKPGAAGRGAQLRRGARCGASRDPGQRPTHAPASVPRFGRVRFDDVYGRRHVF